MKKRVIVLGLGAMGSAAAQHLAQSGHTVLGFDQFHPPHSQGSSHGQSRIIRQSYWEDPRYVPLLLRAYELWRALESQSGRKLLHLTGGLMIGPEAGDLVSRSANSAGQFKLPHEILSIAQMRQRFPAFHLQPGMAALYEDAAGFLLPEVCIAAHLSQAELSGADLHYHEPALAWEPTAGGGVRVRTALGSYEADSLVITAGPWAPQTLASAGLPLEVTRQVLFWFEPLADAEIFQLGRQPVFIMESGRKEHVLYGFPSLDSLGLDGPRGVKVALHGSHNICTPQTINRELTADDVSEIRERLAEMMPALPGRMIAAETCLYTMTPDEHFILDRHPDYHQVVIAAGFSGHGFKFSSVIGEILARMALDQPAGFELGLFSLARFAESR